MKDLEDKQPEVVAAQSKLEQNPATMPPVAAQTSGRAFNFGTNSVASSQTAQPENTAGGVRYVPTATGIGTLHPTGINNPDVASTWKSASAAAA